MNRYAYSISLFLILSLCMGCTQEGEGTTDSGNSNDAGHTDKPGNDIVIQTCDPKDDICLSQEEILHCVDGTRKREYCPSGELCFDGKQFVVPKNNLNHTNLSFIGYRLCRRTLTT